MPIPHYDVVICGSGAGGGVMARRLVESGLNVLLLEAGFDPGGTDAEIRTERTASDDDALLRNYWPYWGEAEVTNYPGNPTTPAHNQAMGKGVGGSTELNGAMAIRIRDEDWDEMDYTLRDGDAAYVVPGTLAWDATTTVVADAAAAAAITAALAAGAVWISATDNPKTSPPFKVDSILGLDVTIVDAGVEVIPNTGGAVATNVFNTRFNRAAGLEAMRLLEKDVDIASLNAAAHGDAGWAYIGRTGGPALGDNRPGVTTPRIQPASTAANNSLMNSAAVVPGFVYVDDYNSAPTAKPAAPGTGITWKTPLQLVLEDSQGNPQTGGLASGQNSIPSKYQERQSTLVTAINPIRAEGNFTLTSQAYVDKVLVENTGLGLRAVGVRYLHKGRDGAWHVETVHADGVVLAAGAQNSPAILQRSGVGPLDRLAPAGAVSLGVETDVGARLLNHVGIVMPFFTVPQATLQGQYTPYNSAYRASIAPDASYAVGAANPSGAILFDDDCHMHLLHASGIGFGQSSISSGPGLFNKQSFKSPSLPVGFPNAGFFNFPRTFLLGLAYHTKPRSRGDGVRVRSADPRQAPKMVNGFYHDPLSKDAEIVLEGAQVMWLKFMDAAAANGLVASGQLTFPGGGPPATVNDVIAQAFGALHPTSTCAMGSTADAMSVCDAKAKVKGIDGLRVCDASVFPHSVRVNTDQPVRAIAWMIADSILEDGEV